MKQLLFILLLMPTIILGTIQEISKEKYKEAVLKNSTIPLAKQKALSNKVLSGIALTLNEQTTWDMLQETNQIMHLYIKQLKNNS